MHDKPRIAVVLDENTSGDASRYEAAKGYFSAIRDAGGLPFGIPYLFEIVDAVVEDFDGLLLCGGRYAYPEDWYVDGASKAPDSERFQVERAIVEKYLARDKPVLGICAGMQLLAGLAGCRLVSDVQASGSAVLDHDSADQMHEVAIASGTKLAQIAAVDSLLVNSSHREAVAGPVDGVVVSARSSDGVIEAIEVTSCAFAIGLQWHQERFAGTDHRGNRVFDALIRACRRPAAARPRRTRAFADR
jgi:putative glutamine amidotransferase